MKFTKIYGHENLELHGVVSNQKYVSIVCGLQNAWVWLTQLIIKVSHTE